VRAHAARSPGVGAVSSRLLQQTLQQAQPAFRWSSDLAHRRSHGWPKLAASHLEKVAGHDPALKRIVQRASRLTHVDLPLILHGESGCGKERFAHALHLDGPRAGKPFVTLNCAAIPESLIESELFGYREGPLPEPGAKGCRGK
jgi:transcriptional regulator with PAS, ATPase and Fis domain